MDNKDLYELLHTILWKVDPQAGDFYSRRLAEMFGVIDPDEESSESVEDPRAWTKEEVRDQLMNQLKQIALAWSSYPNKTPLERCEGVIHSVLAMFDGESAELPAMDIALSPHASDKEFNQGEGNNWYESGMVINDDVNLHDMMKADLTELKDIIPVKMFKC
jgi:hypothetical protein